MMKAKAGREEVCEARNSFNFDIYRKYPIHLTQPIMNMYVDGKYRLRHTFEKLFFMLRNFHENSLFSMMKIEDDFNLRCSRAERKFNFSIRIMSNGSSENSIMKSESFTRRRLNFTPSFYDDEAALENYEHRWRMRIDSGKRGIKL